MFPRVHTLNFEHDEHAPGAYDDPALGSDPPPPREMGDGWNEPVDEPGPAQPAGDTGFDYSDPAFLDAVAAAADQRLDALLKQAAEYDETQQPDDGEGLVDPEVQQYLDARMTRAIDQRFGQIQPTVQAFEDQQNIAQIEDWTKAEPAIEEAQAMLGDTEEGGPSASDLVMFAATGYIEELEARHGPGERATRTAIRMAADQVKGALKAAHDAGYQARNAELQGHVTTRPAGPGGPVEAVRLAEEPKDEMEAMDRIMARNGTQ